MSKFILIVFVLAIGIGTGIVLDNNLLFDGGTEGASDSGERKIAYWVAPMDANYRRDEPGKSPMGMDLVPVYEDELNGGGTDDVNAVRLTPSVINNLGVRTAKVGRGSFRSQIETVGYIDYDESKIVHVHLRAEGWIEKPYVNSVGERVKKGDLLFEIYSPALVNAQGDYLNALGTGRAGIIRASKERLLALDIPKSLIETITKTRKVSQYVKIYAPQDGIVSALNAAEGMFISPRMTVVSLADLSSVWLLVDVFEAQASQIMEGLSAQVRLSYEPARVWEGKIAYVYPQIEPETRTLKVRLEFENPDAALKPDMYADVTIFGKEKPNTLNIPREALIRTGKSERVILALGEGRFQPAAVKAGIESGDRIEILEGLEEGEEIVTSAQFLIDSEASFTGSTLRMSSMQEKPVREIPEKKEEKKEEKKAAEEVWGMGTLNEIMDGQNKVNVTHGPIEALGWPGMTMDFLTAPNLDMSSIKKGTEIHFKIRKTESGMYEIIQIMDMADMDTGNE